MKLTLVGKPFAGGIEWEFQDENGNTIIFDHHGDIEFGLSDFNVDSIGMRPGKKKYMASVTMYFPIKWEGP